MLTRIPALLKFSLCILCAQASSLAEEEYLLRYKLKAGEKLTTKVVHFAETRAKMSDHNEDSNSRTISYKVWEVESVDNDGNMTFVYQLESVNLAQSVGDGEELKFNSLTDKEVPDAFKQVAESLNKPLAKITINTRGQVVDRDKELKAPQLGMGELTLALPENAIAIGKQWSVPRDMRVKLESGAFKKIKVRELYTLEKVSAGLATISVETQPLTPVTDPAVEAQLIQQLSRGKIKFDLSAGRVVSKKLDWSDEVVGFRGPETMLKYDAEFTEELIASQKTAAANTTKR